MGGLICIVLGLLNMLAPMTVWEWTEGRKYKYAEPAEGYLTRMRIVGLIAVLLGAYMFITGKTSIQIG